MKDLWAHMRAIFDLTRDKHKIVTMFPSKSDGSNLLNLLLLESFLLMLDGNRDLSVVFGLDQALQEPACTVRNPE